MKSVDIVGFKSFAEKTHLEFEPGMTAIVGPNGCGKSNVSDAIRWVLGESRARALRGATMEDCIFNGTDSHKPLGMAEVTLTLADCDETLEIGLNEVSITRRVFRTGESDYFINKKACRRKDIQRLFMDTGVGTNSYSVLEQGKIDQILSSRPDDRRAVFEEASGITKYKADKKEALRKLEQTEANLLRLADVIREVKRQIISLQRQAGKAQRYKEIQASLRVLDIYVTRTRLSELETRIQEIRAKLEELRLKVDEAHNGIEAANGQTDGLRAELHELEQTIGNTMDESMRVKNELERAMQTIRTNTERVAELESLAQQNTKESEEAKNRLQQHRDSLEEVLRLIESAETEKKEAAAELERTTAAQRETEALVHAGREELNRMRSESMELDSRIGRLQNELSEIDAKERASVIRKEQLAAEKSGLERSLASYEERRQEMAAQVEGLRQAVAVQEQTLNDLRTQRTTLAEQIQILENEVSELNRQLTDKNARLEMIAADREEGFPPGARHLLESGDENVIGPLAEQFTAGEGFETALETVLRPWMDAVVVKSRSGARSVLTLLSGSGHGSVRLLSADAPAPAAVQAEGIPLISKVSFSDNVAPLASQLLANVFIADSLQTIPITLPAGAVFVTKTGELLTAEGAGELWKPEEGDVNPLGRHHLREQLQGEIEVLSNELSAKQERLSALRTEQSGAGDALEIARGELDARRRSLAVQEGEAQVISRELETARERVETVTFEFNTLIEQKGEGEDRRTAVAREGAEAREKLAKTRQQISTKTEELNALEEKRAEALSATSECRVQFSQREQRLESLQSRRQPLQARLKELSDVIEERTRGVSTYQQRVAQLKETSAGAEAKLEGLKEAVAAADAKLAEVRQVREVKTVTLAERERSLRVMQQQLDELQGQKTSFEVELAEQRMRHQNAADRLTSTWQITLEDLPREPEPEWEDERPDMEELETQVAEYRAKLESMGPVNLVAIEEHAELEERFAFLNQQEDDLTKAKAQLMEMIKKINETTTALFKETFDKVNDNFGEMFKNLFGGGSAKLVLVDEEDVLESGIEIIARPPGKKLQTISLLSGGERTMTAVALLFSLFKVKPSPFCVLDELDAALDEANIGRFVKMVLNFLDQSQFILITHSRQTIAAADVIYGVTMPNRGVSRIMSMKFADYQDSDTAKK
ncbi:chromosome segregation protein SMC [Tichowtungia aerotolerans]|uniref:Chromosome partition protein Smc n=1 Tax=Tichowtungia aerotolerans TaxID=2697043 RepID=A0A6P1MFQ3_9BACT|nr:chromosome segregation protein SMC [Tichowtungia aerotolerans]